VIISILLGLVVIVLVCALARAGGEIDRLDRELRVARERVRNLEGVIKKTVRRKRGQRGKSDRR
jgi:hypothetical protein